MRPIESRSKLGGRPPCSQFASRLDPRCPSNPLRWKIPPCRCHDLGSTNRRVLGQSGMGAQIIVPYPSIQSADDLERIPQYAFDYEQGGWEEGLASYEQVRPLSGEERRVLLPLDQANVVLSGMNWIRWLIVERRTFEYSQTVDQRLDTILRRLRWASESGGISVKF